MVSTPHGRYDTEGGHVRQIKYLLLDVETVPAVSEALGGKIKSGRSRDHPGASTIPSNRDEKAGVAEFVAVAACKETRVRDALGQLRHGR